MTKGEFTPSAMMDILIVMLETHVHHDHVKWLKEKKVLRPILEDHQSFITFCGGFYYKDYYLYIENERRKLFEQKIIAFL